MNKNRNVFLVALLMIAATFIEGRVFAQTAIERLKSEYPAVMEQYGKKLQDLKTHYIFVVDVSGTMDEYKDEVVVPGVKNFIETLPEGDYASIIAFGGKAQVMCTPLKLNSDNRKKLVEELINSYPKDPKDPKDKIKKSLDTNHTYLDKAVVRLLEVVEKNEFNCDICFAVFFSDLCDESNNEWNYKERASKLNDRAFGVVATALRATNENEKQKGIKRMENTFEGFSYSSNVKDVFGEKLEAFKYNIYVPELKKTVRVELNKIFEEMQLSSEIGIGKKVMLHAEINKNTPAFIKGIVVDTAWLTDQSPEIAQVEFVSKPRMPRYSKSLNLGKAVFAQKNKLFHKDQYVAYALKYHLETPEPKTAKDPSFVSDLEQLEIADALYSEAALEAKGSFVFGWPLWLIIVLCIIILVFLVLLIKNTIIPGRIRNKKFYCKNMLGETSVFTVQNMRSFCIGKPDKCESTDWGIPDTGFFVEVKAKNGGPLNLLFKKKIVFTLVDGNDAVMTQDGQKMDKSNILNGPITVDDGFGRPYEFSEADLILSNNN